MAHIKISNLDTAINSISELQEAEITQIIGGSGKGKEGREGYGGKGRGKEGYEGGGHYQLPLCPPVYHPPVYCPPMYSGHGGYGKD